MDARSRLKLAYYCVLWRKEPELRSEYRKLLDAPPEAQLQGARELIQRWVLPPDALAEILLALRRRDAGSEQESPFMPVAYEVQRPTRPLPPPPPDVPQGSALPAYDPDAYSTFERYMKALEGAYEGLPAPTPAEAGYLEAWRRFVASAEECLQYPEPPWGLPEYRPTQETRKQYLRRAVAQADWAQVVMAGFPFAEMLTPAERRNLLPNLLVGYCRAVEEWYRQAGYRLRRERNRELSAREAEQWARWVYLRVHKGLLWKQVRGESDTPISTVRSAVEDARKILGI